MGLVVVCVECKDYCTPVISVSDVCFLPGLCPDHFSVNILTFLFCAEIASSCPCRSSGKMSYITSRDFLGVVRLTGVIILHARLFNLCRACSVSVLQALCPHT